MIWIKPNQSNIALAAAQLLPAFGKVFKFSRDWPVGDG
jgi:hypothetical protein